jgi:photosystem II Psb27 protein
MAMKMSGETSAIPSSPSSSVSQSLRQLAVPFTIAAAAASILVPRAFADDAPAVVATPAAPVAPAKPELGPPPADWGLKQVYYDDCQKVINHMRYAVQLEKGNPLLVEVATKTKEEINEFVAYYRRFQGISGKQSFSLLYTSINVLAGHYTSYGLKFPVPEKRRKRLLQEFNDIEKNIRKKR